MLVVDGGQPQVNAAAAALTEIGVVDVTVVGLAKRLEEVWLPGDDEPVILPRTSEALYLLQRLRDEAHRFAITYHREKRSKSMTVSALDGVPGLGRTRRAALLKHFGSVAKLRAASPGRAHRRARASARPPRPRSPARWPALPDRASRSRRGEDNGADRGRSMGPGTASIDDPTCWFRPSPREDER